MRVAEVTLAALGGSFAVMRIGRVWVWTLRGVRGVAETFEAVVEAALKEVQ